MDPILERYQALEDKIKEYNPALDAQRLFRAFTYADNAHAGQLRKDGSPYITDFGEVTVENAAGWFNVEKKAEFQQEELSLSEDGKTAIIPFTYYASIGSGANPETGVVDIDLNKLSKPK